MSFEPNRQTGANKQSRRSPTPRTLLKELMSSSANPHLAEERERIFRDFRERVLTEAGVNIDELDPEALIEPVLEYWLTNNYRSLLADFPLPGAPTREERVVSRRAAHEGRVEEIRGKVVKAAAKTAQLLLLDWLLPNGKALRDCSGRECRQMSRKVGPWLAKVAGRLKPNQIVGKVLKEEDIRKLYGR